MQISVFDLDHTLLKANSSFLFGIFLYRQKLMSLSTLSMCLMTYARHKYFNLSVKKLHHYIFSIFFAGKSLSEINRLVGEFLDYQFNAMIRNTVREKLQIARERGDYTVILSSSPDFLVAPIAHLLKVDEWMGTQYSVDENNRFSAVSFICEGEEKAFFMKALSHRLNIPLSSFAMYSDSHLDLPGLLIVGKAVAVSPNKVLKKISIQNGWEII